MVIKNYSELDRMFKPYFTTMMAAADLGRVVIGIEAIMKSVPGNKGFGCIKIEICNGKISQIDTTIKDRIKPTTD